MKEEGDVSNFGDLVKRLRKEKGLTLEAVAKKIGSHKGYVSGIENAKVNPPSVKIIRKFARLFTQDERTLVRMAWADKAPPLIRDEARRLVALAESEAAGTSADLAKVPLLNAAGSPLPSELGADNRPKTTTGAVLSLPKGKGAVDLAATLPDDSMEGVGNTGLGRGTVVLLAREEKLRSGSLVYIVFKARGKSQGLVRQVMLEQGDNIVLQPLNKEFPLEFLTHDDIDAAYRVVGKIESFEGVTADMSA
jgi:transcriptional regulator with XRE-family HTH domain